MLKTKAKKRKKKASKASLIIFGVFAFSLMLFLGCRMFLHTHNTRLSASNQELQNSIDSVNSQIEVLQSEIAQLQDKSRVLGMLEGQVTDNQDNVIYYDQN